MRITIEFTTGKKIELTQEELNELFPATRIIPYMPFVQPIPVKWPDYTVTCATSTGSKE